MNKLFEKILGSLDNGDNGASGKKMTALVVTITCLVFPTVRWSIWAYSHNDWNLLTTIIGLYIGFVTLLFGINEVGKKYKNKDTSDTENK